MLYLFTGNSDFLVKDKVKKWKEHFISKYGEFNLVHFKDINSVNNNILVESITSTSFLSEKKLVIIDLDKEISTEKEDFLLKIIGKIPDENILLFSSIKPDKRNSFYKKLVKLSEVHNCETKNDSDLFTIISQKYGTKISNSGINTLIKYKSGNLTKIISEIEKLLINFSYIDNKEITENIIPELEEIIFQIIDSILNKNIDTAIKQINIILNHTNIYAFYNNLLSNLRTNSYILKMKALKADSKIIAESLNLGNRSFLINKNYKANSKEISTLYIDLINIDKKMKTGKLLGSEKKDFQYELEKALLKLK